jgi:hypothetical protein
MSLSVEIFDQRGCLLGEGPTVTGMKNIRGCCAFLTEIRRGALTSSAFVGKNLGKLIITSAKEDEDASGANLSGMTFIVDTGVCGERNFEFSV